MPLLLAWEFTRLHLIVSTFTESRLSNANVFSINSAKQSLRLRVVDFGSWSRRGAACCAVSGQGLPLLSCFSSGIRRVEEGRGGDECHQIDTTGGSADLEDHAGCLEVFRCHPLQWSAEAL